MSGRHDCQLLRFSRVTLGYSGTAVLQNLSFHICRGEFLGIVGPNGSVKTTILRAILGLLKPQSGTIERLARPVLGYVPQRERIDSIIPVTALEVALMGRAPRLGPLQRIRAHDHQRAAAALDLAGVSHLAPCLYRDLSGGQQQRVLLARALAGDPDLLVLDEPTNGMDLASEHAIVVLLRRLNRERGLTVLLVTHLLQTVLDAATTILLIENGRVLYGDAEDVLQGDRLSELYGLPVELTTHAGRRTLVVGNPEAADV
ncbi:MAG: metal ABC transporter ATP-binding protein [Acidobacteriota bacterium]